MFQQAIIIVGGIFGLFVLYFVGRFVIASVSPETDEKFELHFILKDIKRHFGFLLEKGYKIREAHYSVNPNGSWYVELQSKNCVVSIVQDRSEISAYVSPASGSTDSKNQVAIEAMIYFLSEGKNITGSYKGNLAWGKKKQFERLANLLRTHIEQIASYFGDNFSDDKNILRNAQQEYSNAVSYRRHSRK
jgi:hypothetical protein